MVPVFLWRRDRRIRCYGLELGLSQLGCIRAVVSHGRERTKIEWAQDSTWRFLPIVRSEAA